MTDADKKNADAVSHQIPEELSERDMQTVNGGVDIRQTYEIPHLGRVTSNGSIVSSMHAPSSPNKTFGERFGKFANTEFGKSSMAGMVGLSTAVSAYSTVHAIQKNKHPDTPA